MGIAERAYQLFIFSTVICICMKLKFFLGLMNLDKLSFSKPIRDLRAVDSMLHNTKFITKTIAIFFILVYSPKLVNLSGFCHFL